MLNNRRAAELQRLRREDIRIKTLPKCGDGAAVALRIRLNRRTDGDIIPPLLSALPRRYAIANQWNALAVCAEARWRRRPHSSIQRAQLRSR